MISLSDKYRALEALGYDCDTTAGEIAAWRDARPQPESWDAIIAEWQASAAFQRKTWANAAAFLGEFSLEEMATISLSTDPTIAALRLLLASWPADVWSDDPRIQLGLGKLVAVGIIDEARRAAILTK